MGLNRYRCPGKSQWFVQMPQKKDMDITEAPKQVHIVLVGPLDVPIHAVASMLPFHPRSVA